MSKQKKVRTRLSPEARKSMILDHAAGLVASEGVSALTMDRLARDAGVSKSLIYAYYPSTQDLLKELLTREYRHLRGLQIEAAESAVTFEQLVRRVTSTYLSYIERRGLLLTRLAAEPSVTNHNDPTEYSRDASVKYMAQILVDNFDIDVGIAVPAVDISFGIPAAAGHYLTRHDIDRQTLEDITVTMIIGSIEALQQNFETSLKPLIKRKIKDDS